jgi:hypothetical protein
MRTMALREMRTGRKVRPRRTGIGMVVAMEVERTVEKTAVKM